MIEAAISENASLAVQWELYAVELFLQGAEEEDITLCLDEAQLHWEWVVAWQERQDNTLDALYEDFDIAGVSNYVPDYAVSPASGEEAYELAQAYELMTSDYPAYV